MKILWLNWKDGSHPQAGGAELVNEELAKRLVRDGHEVVFIVSHFQGAQKEEERNGFKIIRAGGRSSVYWHAYRIYKARFQGWPDLVIDEINTIPFLASLYVKERTILFIHQLCREIWFYQIPFPISLIGYILEPIYLWLLNQEEVITVSASTKKDLIRYGFSPEKIHIISEGIELKPVSDLNSIAKYPVPTILSFGSIRPMKRTHHIVKAFEILKKSIPTAKLIIAGSAQGSYGKKVLAMIKSSAFAKDIEYIGKTDEAGKMELMQKSHVIAATSIKEGWGLIVTEANSQGTPAVVYNVDGLRDSVSAGKTGLITKENRPKSLAEALAEILKLPLYSELQKNAWQWSKEVNFENAYKDLLKVLKHE